MDCQVEDAFIGAANAFYPTIAGRQFGIPAITGIRSHLVRQMLAGTKLCLVDTDAEQERMNAS
jgi:hypothetical protein